MTYQEYAKKVADDLSSNISNYKEIISKAEQKINQSDISEQSKTKFWLELSKQFELNNKPECDYSKLHAISESQGADELSKIIAKAKSVIAQKTK
ncbi:TPA: hypothetical protein ACKRFQ_000686 [Proteus mirabilis]